jgi:hypothetical protein
MPRLAATLPRLDDVHRAHSPLDPGFRARMRRVSAHANPCAYAEAYALTDARRIGLGDAAIEALRRDDLVVCAVQPRVSSRLPRSTVERVRGELGRLEASSVARTHGHLFFTTSLQ